MDSSDNFALMVPVIQASFGIVFVLLHRSGIRTASRWGAAYFLSCAAICVYVLPIDVSIQTLIVDALFLASYYYFGEALLLRYGAPLHAQLRLGLTGLVFLADVYVVYGLQSLSLNILLIDATIAALLGVPLVLVARHMRRGIDLVIAICAGVSALHNFGMAIIFGLIEPTTADLAHFLASDYAYLMQFAGGIFGVWFGLAVLAAVSLDTLAEYRKAADHDPLTGLLNRRGFHAAAAPLLASGGPGTILICDIDWFKAINDNFGHEAGDLVLVGLADILRSILPNDSVIARFGGEEFVVLLPNVSQRQGGVLAHSLRLACAAQNWSLAGVSRQVSMCVGVAQLLQGEAELAKALSRADAALYAAKANGRNQVMFMHHDGSQPISRAAAAA